MLAVVKTPHGNDYQRNAHATCLGMRVCAYNSLNIRFLGLLPCRHACCVTHVAAWPGYTGSNAQQAKGCPGVLVHANCLRCNTLMNAAFMPSWFAKVAAMNTVTQARFCAWARGHHQPPPKQQARESPKSHLWRRGRYCTQSPAPRTDIGTSACECKFCFSSSGSCTPHFLFSQSD
jgi:hypothetical protein